MRNRPVPFQRKGFVICTLYSVLMGSILKPIYLSSYRKDGTNTLFSLDPNEAIVFCDIDNMDMTLQVLCNCVLHNSHNFNIKVSNDRAFHKDTRFEEMIFNHIENGPPDFYPRPVSIKNKRINRKNRRIIKFLPCDPADIIEFTYAL